MIKKLKNKKKNQSFLNFYLKSMEKLLNFIVLKAGTNR